MKKIIQWKLKILAKTILNKYNPKVIGITGSVGKTSAKEAIYSVLKGKFNVRRSIKNYNNELGVPLTIIGVESPGSHLLGWFHVFFVALKLILFKDKNYPKVLILEMGVDRPGDMDYLNKIVKCDIGVITLIGVSHLEYFGSIGKIQKEKAKLIGNINKNGFAVINFDDAGSREIAQDSKIKTITYGFEQGAKVRAGNLSFKFKEKKDISSLFGTNFKLNYSGSFAPVSLSKSVGDNVVYASLAAAGVGIAMEMNIVEIAGALKNYNSMSGRMKIISGIKHTIIIDDTYNASPQSSLSAISFIEKLNQESDFRKVAVFGDMLELGKYSEEGHKKVGEALARAKFDLIVAVGERARDILRGAKELARREEHLFYFEKNEEAGNFVQNRIKKGDLVLVKGSQGARMEQIVKEIMAEPLRAKELLVRQDRSWS